MKVVLFGAGVVFLPALVVVLLVVVFVTPPAHASCSSGNGGAAGGRVDVAAIPPAPVAGYGHEQLVNAAHIMNAATDLDLPTDAQRIGVMTAMGESGLRVLDYGDTAGPDSRGLFQQRSNGAWGSLADRMDPTISSTNFFTALIAVAGWADLEPSIAAHRVQGNSDPHHYARWWAASGEVITALGGTSSGGGGSGCQTGSVALPLDRPFMISSHFGKRPTPTPGASSNHPATDMVGHCGDPVYAIVAGTVTKSDRLWLSVTTDAGYTVSYLHMHRWDRLVDVGDTVAAGDAIGAVGNEAPSTGCHLDLRINTAGNNDPVVAGLPVDASLPGWVDPEDFMAAHGTPLMVDAA